MADVQITSDQVQEVCHLLLEIAERSTVASAGLICLMPETVERIKYLTDALKEQGLGPIYKRQTF